MAGTQALTNTAPPPQEEQAPAQPQAAAPQDAGPQPLSLGEATQAYANRGDEADASTSLLVRDQKKATKDAQKAVDADAGTDAAIATAQRPVYDEMQKAAETHALQMAHVADLRASAQKQLEALQQSSEAFANDKLEDPMLKQGIGTQLFGLVAQAFGGFVSGLTGGPNVPAQMIDQKMRQMLDIQKFNIMHNKEAAGMQQGILSSMLKTYGDMDTAYAASYAALQNGLKTRLDKTAADYKSAKVMASAQQTKAALEQHGVDQTSKLVQFDEGQRQKMVQGEADLAKTKALADTMMERAQLSASTKPGMQESFAGPWQLPPDMGKSEKAKARQEFTESSQLEDRIGQVIKSINGLDLTDPQAQTMLRSRIQSLVPILRKRFNTGAAFSVNEERNIDAQIGTLLSSNVAPEMTKMLLQDLLQREQKATMRYFKTAHAKYRPETYDASDEPGAQ